MTKPYTYLIGWTEHQKFYYGVRYAENCHPDELMKSYFTSSKHVKNFIKNFGMPDLIQIRKTFDDKKKAYIWENKVLLRLDVINHAKFLNRTTNRGIPPEYASKHLHGKTYEEAYGQEKAKILREKRSQSNRNRTGIKYRSMNRSTTSNDMKICCLICRHQTSVAQFNRHLNKHL